MAWQQPRHFQTPAGRSGAPNAPVQNLCRRCTTLKGAPLRGNDRNATLIQKCWCAPSHPRRGRPLCRPANPPARFPRLYGQDKTADVVIIVKNGLPNLANSPNFFPSALHLLTFRFRIVIFICRGTGNVSGNDSENALRRISVCLGELWRSDDKGYCEGLRREREHRVARPQ